MSHQAGIKACDDLKSFFAKSKQTNVRLIQISIENEQLVLSHSEDIQSTWDEDWNKMILPLLKKDQPTYIMFKLDDHISSSSSSSSSSGFYWVFISFSPDFSPIRQKMLYASTKATLRNEFGSSHIKDELFGTVEHDVNLEGYKKHIVSHHAPKPLSQAEEEMEMIRKSEVNTNIGVDTKHQTVQGVSFPPSKEAIGHLEKFKKKEINYLQLSLDLEKEVTNLETSGNLKVDQIVSKVPSDHARYHLYYFDHMHEGDQQKACVFIYTMPGYNCSIKERMLYSTCKGPLLDLIEKQMEIIIDRKVEIDDLKEITAENLYNEVHPPKNIAKKKFDKPKGPAGRGPKRLTKAIE